VRRVFALEIEALQDTVRHLDAEATRRAVEALAGAGGVLFVGTGAAMALSELAAYRLKVLGLRASWAGDPGTILPEIHLLGPGDVLCAISYHGATRHVVAALDHARQRGLTTICLTAVPGSPAAQRADIRLVAFGQQTALGFGQFASRVAAATLLDALAAAVAWRRDEAVAHATELVAVMQGNNTVAERRRAPRTAAPAAAAGGGNGTARANGKGQRNGRGGDEWPR
jgi:RpiR family carbohydrate utilization transcriptional regulator